VARARDQLSTGRSGSEPSPSVGVPPHHPEEVAQAFAVDVDLDVVAQGGGGVVKSRFEFAELTAQVFRQTSLVERAS
jgi:hypothetical protein